MIHRARPLLIILLSLATGLVGCGAQPLPPLDSAHEPALRTSIAHLTSESLEGRAIGTVGLEGAAHYLAGYFEGLGLATLPGHTWFHPFIYTRTEGLKLTTHLTFAGVKLQRGNDYHPAYNSPEGSFEGTVAFVGYAVSAPDKDYDDFAGVNLKGKIALAMRFEPQLPNGDSQLAGASWSEHAPILRKAKEAADRGAVALVLATPPGRKLKDSLVMVARNQSATAPIPVYLVEQQIADRLLAAGGMPDLKTMQAHIDSAFSPRSVILRNTKLSGTVAFQRNSFNLKNVVAFVPGRGALADEYIVIGAHYDHIGRGAYGSRSPGSRLIHPGADDNASGTAALLELARLFEGRRAGRSLLFVGFSAEEVGLIGSKYFVENPPVSLSKIKAMINLDMVGRLRSNQLTVGGVGTSAAFGPIIQAVDEQSPLKVTQAWKDGIAPSDCLPFVQKGIPILFFFTGMHADQHRVSDTPDKINYAGQAQVVDFAAAAIEQLRSAPAINYSPSAAKPTTTPAEAGQ